MDSGGALCFCGHKDNFANHNPKYACAVKTTSLCSDAESAWLIFNQDVHDFTCGSCFALEISSFKTQPLRLSIRWSNELAEPQLSIGPASTIGWIHCPKQALHVVSGNQKPIKNFKDCLDHQDHFEDQAANLRTVVNFDQSSVDLCTTTKI